MKLNKKATAKPGCPYLSLEGNLMLTYVMIMGAEKEGKKCIEVNFETPLISK